MLDEFDKKISVLSESIARGLNRRQLLSRAAKGMAATAAGLALSQLTNLKSAFAVTCTCSWYGGSGNANCPQAGGCPGGHCPSSCSTCASPTCGCPWQYGEWVSCSGLGRCGTGFEVCTDCHCNGCNYLCTCLSQCICCSPCCQTPQEITAEMQRWAASYAA